MSSAAMVASKSGRATLIRGSPHPIDMHIALLGGTGDIGEGLALRWAADTEHTVVVGSRESRRRRGERLWRRTTDFAARSDYRLTPV